MTGFGRARGPVGRDWTGEIVARSVNGRFLDLTVKTKESEISLEPHVRRVFSGELHRGKVDVAVRLRRTTPAAASPRCRHAPGSITWIWRRPRCGEPRPRNPL